MASAPLVSVIMSVYNGEPFLHKSIDSILDQTFTNFELIIIDDASTDCTPAILDNCNDTRMVRLTNSQNVGLTRSLNRGLAIAKGDFIARHDADDISYPDRFQHQVAMMLEQPSLAVVGTSYHYIDRHGKILRTVILEAEDSKIRKLLPHQNLFCHGSVMLRRDVLEKVGGYHEGFPVTQDYDLWLRLSEHCQLANLASPLYQFRFDGETISRKKANLQLAYDRLARELAIQRRTFGVEDEIPDDVLNTFPVEPIRQFNKAREAAYLFYAAGQMDQANKTIKQAQEISNEQACENISWEDWTWSHARELANLRHNAREGTKFILWIFDTLQLPQNRELSKQTLGRFYADQAFWAYKTGLKRQVFPSVKEAVRHDWTWLRNRGLWVISWRSLCQR